MDITLVINAIKAIVPATVSPIINAVQRNKTVIEIKEKLGINSAQPPEKFDDVYVHALVEYGFDKPQLELNLRFFDNQKVRKVFSKAFSKQPLDFNHQEWNPLRDEAQKAKIDVLQVQEFHQVFVDVAKRSINPGQVITNVELQEHLKKSTEPLEQSLYPDEFKALIEEKTKAFCGRQFVFKEFDDFLEKHTKGYFTVIGDAGMGKSAIAAQSVSKYKAICYFNILAEGRNKPDKFLQSIRKQLINRYQLQNEENADFATLLTKVSAKFVSGERLIIVVDALDEVEETSAAGNILDLPKHLPEGIYFLLTRRPYALNKKSLLTEGVLQEELDLTAKKYEDFNRSDIREYISFCISDDSELKNRLQKWIQSRSLTGQEFIEQLVVKSENNFMYLRYVLQDIAQEVYKDLTIDKLPQGLQDYYQQHWMRMDMDKAPQELMVIILFILVRLTTSPTFNLIAEIAEVEEHQVEKVLDKWVEYLRKWEIEGQMCYSIYHTSFLDFLKAQRDLQRTRRLFQIVDQRISEYLY
ncbi:NACHT domain protein [Nostoc sp.]|uniref:NACHT domain protein n=1 Tax=Nostoc sp. TaxID=1180 RepID=UPI002FF90909